MPPNSKNPHGKPTDNKPPSGKWPYNDVSPPRHTPKSRSKDQKRTGGPPTPPEGKKKELPPTKWSTARTGPGRRSSMSAFEERKEAKLLKEAQDGEDTSRTAALSLDNEEHAQPACPPNNEEPIAETELERSTRSEAPDAPHLSNA
jgi:hypothetical protein